MRLCCNIQRYVMIVMIHPTEYSESKAFPHKHTYECVCVTLMVEAKTKDNQAIRSETSD